MTLSQEKDLIYQFLLNHLIKDRYSRGVATADLFEGYKRYLNRNEYPKTELSIDSFGKLFPKSFKRRTIYFNESLTAKGIARVRLLG